VDNDVLFRAEIFALNSAQRFYGVGFTQLHLPLEPTGLQDSMQGFGHRSKGNPEQFKVAALPDWVVLCSVILQVFSTHEALFGCGPGLVD
jgi:hypothetical protein